MQPDHLHITARYVPATHDVQVGGDWYDTFLVADGSTQLVVGYASAHGREAAAAMGQRRNVLRGLAYALVEPPAAVLSALGRAMGDLDVPTLVTAVLAKIEQTPAEAATGMHTLRWSNAGHPPPLVLQPPVPWHEPSARWASPAHRRHQARGLRTPVSGLTNSGPER